MAELDSFLSLIPSANRNQPLFRAWASVLLQGLVDAATVAEGLQTLFDIDNAVGAQLDKIGQWVGVSRNITEPLATLFFSWGVPGLGWGQGLWASPFEPPSSQVVALDDSHYRILLKARIAANQWDGTIPGAYAAWNDMFAPEGFQILIQNVQAKAPPPNAVAGSKATGDMHILLGLIGPPIDALTEALFTGGYLDLRPAGVSVDAHFTQTLPGAPVFAWGVGPSPSAGFVLGQSVLGGPDPLGSGVASEYTAPPTNLAGWGLGAWANFSATPVVAQRPRPNLSADTLVMLEVASGTLRADVSAPIELASHTRSANAFAAIESAGVATRSDANTNIESR